VAGDNINGCYNWNFQNNVSERPSWQNLLKHFREEFKEISYPTICPQIEYDMVYLTKLGMEKAQVTGDPKKLQEERNNVREYLRNLKDYHGIQFDFDIASGNIKEPSYLFVLNKDGKKLLETYPYK